MPITPSFPGVYIEELASNSRTITPAPTSVAVFIGYTHPFKTTSFGMAVRLFSFADYEREFGGFFTSLVFESDPDFKSVAHAVYQFFLNGGSDCYVIGLEPILQTDPVTTIDQPTGDLALAGNGNPVMEILGLEPTDTHDIALTFSNFQNTLEDNDTADIVITYGTRVETFRSVNLSGKDNADPIIASNYIDNRINGVSSLISIPLDPPATAFDPNVLSLTLSSSPDPTVNPLPTVFNPVDFTGAFATDSDLDKVPVFNLMVIPGVTHSGVLSAALSFCERKMAFFIMDALETDTPITVSAYLDAAPKSANGALYYPYIKSSDPGTGDTIEVPPSGTVAGIFARTDVRRGVWKAPAGLEALVLNTTGVVDSGRMNDPRQGVLNLLGVNCLRSFPNIGTVVYGSRTLVSANPAYQPWKYVPVRRMALFLEQTLLRNLTWAVFEPNDVPLWDALRISVDNFMLGLFNQGALQGTKPSEAFRVICDSTTTTPSDVANGIVNIVVMFAPLKPAEFVIVKIAQLAGQAQV